MRLQGGGGGGGGGGGVSGVTRGSCGVRIAGGWAGGTGASAQSRATGGLNLEMIDSDDDVLLFRGGCVSGRGRGRGARAASPPGAGCLKGTDQ